MIDQFSEHTNRVKSIFNRVASKYDLMNDLMSFGLHRVWKRQFVQRLSVKPDAHYVDVAAGTGDITRLIHKKIMGHGLTPCITAVDPNEAMMGQGKAKLIDKGIIAGVNWVQASAEELPFDDNSVDALTISFGLRNVTDREKALREFHRVLKPGGQFLCLEFSEVQHKHINAAYTFYSQNVIPKLGNYIVEKQEDPPYEYLVDSIQRFPNQPTLKDMIESAGFKTVNFTNLTDGIVAIHEGWK
ncbi:bifunctional demethylmenaquinone methyltransferase/2-methoxy-6-polyprenyl-1,4-benzoquinol methylase UbiE [Candidatus Bodocaedibacter vickermanii]|uniref:Ubiquinone/menaquinone biosynthesis C-methyltransferase UbiE n=1 Tax=Candidatus Bodocaedibacter vickermanii TaxID=2741701 RepID=A0A7L9RSW0_9PROT|nr:Ubiquinone/menaquinone biosynthesis C-methyltransferase UbiE [Candidatus Paracaedibacteraceae bacterium 'Lake Konstanz']